MRRLHKAGGLMLVAALAAWPLFAGTLGVRTTTEILYFALLACAFNLMLGYAGLLSFGINATFGVSAYVLALVLVHAPAAGFWFAALAAKGAAAVCGAGIGALCVRLRGGYFSLLTLAFGQFLLAIALKWRAVTQGEDGLVVPVPSASLLGLVELRLDNTRTLYWLTLAVTVGCLWLMWRFLRTPLGHAVVLVRENDLRASFLGIDSYRTKVAVFTLASTLAGVAGILYALFQRLASPSMLGLPVAGDVLFMTVLGGSGHLLGPALGAAVYHLLQDRLSQFTEHWAFFIGAMFVALVLFAPAGLTGVITGLLRRSAREETP